MGGNAVGVSDATCGVITEDVPCIPHMQDEASAIARTTQTIFDPLPSPND